VSSNIINVFFNIIKNKPKFVLKYQSQVVFWYHNSERRTVTTNTLGSLKKNIIFVQYQNYYLTLNYNHEKLNTSHFFSFFQSKTLKS
jgi:hypothetical protein